MDTLEWSTKISWKSGVGGGISSVSFRKMLNIFKSYVSCVLKVS